MPPALSAVPFVSQVRLRFGPAVTLIDLSPGGAEIETSHRQLQPGAMVIIEMLGLHGRRAIPAQVLRCQLASLQPELVYRVALVFAHPVDLNDLGADAVVPMANDPDPAVASAQLNRVLAGLALPSSGGLPSADVVISDALGAALSILDTPAGRRAGLPLAAALARLFNATTNRLTEAPTSTALVASIVEQLKHAVPARAIGDAEFFVPLPGREVLVFAISCLDWTTPVRRLAIEVADGCELVEWHVQLLKAGMELIAIARELGRRHGGDRALTAAAIRACDEGHDPPRVVVIDDRRSLPEPMASSEYRITPRHAEATLVLSSGQVVRGQFRMGDSAPDHGRELVAGLLNSTIGFVPFERMDNGVARLVLYNLAHIIMVTLADNETRRVPGYEDARRHVVSLLLSNTQRIVGAVRAHLPAGHDRVSDWARDSVTFRYLETDEATVIVNVQHVTDITEVAQL